MTDLNPQSLQMTVQALNETPLSLHLEILLRQEKATIHPDSLMLFNLMDWAAKNHYPNQMQGDLEAGAVAMAEADDPEAVQSNLADDRMLQAETLKEAAELLVGRLQRILA